MKSLIQAPTDIAIGTAVLVVTQYHSIYATKTTAKPYESSGLFWVHVADDVTGSRLWRHDRVFLVPGDAPNVWCDDCGGHLSDPVTRGDHHGGLKTVCRDRMACHARESGR